MRFWICWRSCKLGDSSRIRFLKSSNFTHGLLLESIHQPANMSGVLIQRPVRTPVTLPRFSLSFLSGLISHTEFWPYQYDIFKSSSLCRLRPDCSVGPVVGGSCLRRRSFKRFRRHQRQRQFHHRARLQGGSGPHRQRQSQRPSIPVLNGSGRQQNLSR